MLKSVHGTDDRLRLEGGGSKYLRYNTLRTTFDVPRYLKRFVPHTLAQGRALKTRFRCDTHELESDRGRYAGSDLPPSERICQCCCLGLPETPYHFIFDCLAYSEIRHTMYDAIDTITRDRDVFSWRTMSWEHRELFLLSDGPPVSDHESNLQWVRIETCFYYFLTKAIALRRAQADSE